MCGATNALNGMQGTDSESVTDLYRCVPHTRKEGSVVAIIS